MVFDTVARHYQDLHASDGESQSIPHFIISNLEHDSVDLTAKKMEELGRIGMWPNTTIVYAQYHTHALFALYLHRN